VSDKKAICDAIPATPFDDVTKPISPMRLQSPDRADAPPFVLADSELCMMDRKQTDAGTVSKDICFI